MKLCAHSFKCTWNVSLNMGIVFRWNFSFMLDSHHWPRYQYRCNQWNQPNNQPTIVLSYFWHRPKLVIWIECECVCVCLLSDQLRYDVYFSYQGIWCFCSNHSLIVDPHFESRNWLHFRVGYWVLSHWFVCVCLWIDSTHPRIEHINHVHTAFWVHLHVRDFYLHLSLANTHTYQCT